MFLIVFSAINDMNEKVNSPVKLIRVSNLLPTLSKTHIAMSMNVRQTPLGAHAHQIAFSSPNPDICKIVAL